MSSRQLVSRRAQGCSSLPAAVTAPRGAAAARTEHRTGAVLSFAGLVPGSKAHGAALVCGSQLGPRDPAPSQHEGGTSYPALLGAISKIQGKGKLFPSTLYF